MSSTDIAYAASMAIRIPCNVRYEHSVCQCCCYAKPGTKKSISGTNIEYGASVAIQASTPGDQGTQVAISLRARTPCPVLAGRGSERRADLTVPTPLPVCPRAYPRMVLPVCYAISGTDLAYASSAIPLLRTRYAMSSTELAHAPTRLSTSSHRWYCPTRVLCEVRH
eukprot:1566720-Rhodomonas_salina.3